MTPASISITELQVFTQLRAFVQTLIDPASTEVIRTQGNRVATPKGAFIALTPLSLERLATNIASYNTVAQTQALLQAVKVTVQVDCYGTSSADQAVILTTALRSEFASQFFDACGVDMQTLYASDPQQLPLVTGESQFLERWHFEAVLQTNPVTTLVQQNALAASMKQVINVDATYLPL